MHYAQLSPIPTKWRTYRDHRLCDVNSRHVYREKLFYSPQANNQRYKQNELMWQAAREEIPI